MNTDRRRSLPVLAGAALCLAAALGSSQGVAAPQTPETPENRVRMIATIQSVDTNVPEIRFLTGTGFALRLVRAEVGESCRINAAGRAARLVDLKRGGIVRVECQRNAGRLVAVVIETVPLAEEEPRP